MAASPKVLVALAVAAAAGATGATAHAEAPDVFPVEVSAARPGAFITVRGAGLEIPCAARCVLHLPQHQYRIIIRDADGHESAEALNIFHPIALSVSPGDHGNKMLGIGLFAGGVAAVVAGAAAFYLALRDHSSYELGECGSGCSDVAPWRWYAGGVSVAAGLALGAGGLVIWHKNAHAVVDARPPTGGF